MTGKQAESCNFKLAAVDLDGTLLSPDLSISVENRAAVARLQRLGVEVAFVSGRHFQTMSQFAKTVPGISWIISVQGGEVANLDRSQILEQRFLDPLEVERTARLGLSRGQMVVGYGAHGSLALEGRGEDFNFYSTLAGHPPRVLGLDEFLASPIFKIVWAGTPAEIEQLAHDPGLGSKLSERVRSHHRLLEFVPPGVSKATGLATLGAHLGITRDEMLAFGDAENDIPMLQWTGRGVAMGHGWPAALASAKLIAPAGAEESAFARGVDLALATA